MKAFYILAALAVATVAYADSQEKGGVDCSKRNDGNYANRDDCNGFVSCSGGIARERACARCSIDSRRCPDGRLVYNSTQDACTWADETRCERGGNSGENSGESSEESVEDGPSDGSGDEGTTEGNASNPNPTDQPNPNPTEQPSPIPRPGDSCNHEECVNVGYCQSYLRCDKVSSKWVQEECGENIVWNPLNSNGTRQVHGGNCDVWANLSPAVERTYRTDPDCLACFWRARGECNREYDYQPINGTHRNVLRLSCAEGLVFSQEKETCQRCEDVRRSNGSACC